MVESPLAANLLNTVIAALVLGAIFIVVYFLFARKFESKKQRLKFRHRLLYVAIIVFLLVLTRIWIEGFTHLFAMLSLVAAGIVVTNKETIMNFVGWLVIDWRGSFIVGDLVFIQSYCGYISEIGPLYFRMHEVVENEYDRATGVTVKLPNSLIITNPIKVISYDESLCMFSIFFTVGVEGIDTTINNIKNIVGDVIRDKYGKKLISVKEKLFAHKKQLARLIDLEPKISMKEFSAANEVKLAISFYCNPKDFRIIKNQVLHRVIQVAASGAVCLAE